MSAPITVLAYKLAYKLRDVIVQEWLGSTRCNYECFVDNTEDYEVEVHNFLQGYYNSDLGTPCL